MNIGEITKKIWEIIGYAGEALDFIGDIVVGQSILKGETGITKEKKENGEKITAIEKLRARFADIGRGDEAIIARLLGKLDDKDRATFLGFKMWLAEKDKIKYFILRRHITYFYGKNEKETLELLLDIISKLELGGNEAALGYCNGMEITYDSTIALFFELITLIKKIPIGKVDKRINRISRETTTNLIKFVRKREKAIADRPFWKFW